MGPSLGWAPPLLASVYASRVLRASVVARYVKTFTLLEYFLQSLQNITFMVRNQHENQPAPVVGKQSGDLIICIVYY